MKNEKMFWGDYPIKDDEKEEIFSASTEPIKTGGLFLGRFLIRFFVWTQTNKKFRATVEVNPETKKSYVKFSFVNELTA